MKANIINKVINGDFVKGTAEINGKEFDFEIEYLGGEVHNLAIGQGGRYERTVKGLGNFDKVKKQFEMFGLI